MIKVLHLRDTDKVCGPGKTIMETACRIDNQRYELIVGLFLKTPEQENRYRDALEQRGVKVIPIIARSQFSLSVINAILNVIKIHEIDIVHAHDYKSDILTALITKIIDIPTVTTAHGWITNSLKSKFYIWLGKQSYRFFDQVIAVSPKIQNEISRFGVKNDKLSLIYNAIVADNYQPQCIPSGYLYNKFDLSSDTKIIGNIGRISPEKGQIDFILAAKIMLETRNDLAFVLTGDGPDRDKAEKLVSELGIDAYIHFTGHESDVRPIFKDLTLFALTSYTEGFPNVVLESLCMDIPVLATDVGGTGDIIENNVTGILIDSGNPKAIAHGLTILLDNPVSAKSMTAAGKEKIMTHYEFKTRVKKIEALYDKLMND